MTPDITMCSNNGCPIRHDCYRYRGIPSSMQSWSYFLYFNGRCDHYAPIYAGRRVRSVQECDSHE